MSRRLNWPPEGETEKYGKQKKFFKYEFKEQLDLEISVQNGGKEKLYDREEERY